MPFPYWLSLGVQTSSWQEHPVLTDSAVGRRRNRASPFSFCSPIRQRNNNLPVVHTVGEQLFVQNAA